MTRVNNNNSHSSWVCYRYMNGSIGKVCMNVCLHTWFYTLRTCRLVRWRLSNMLIYHSWFSRSNPVRTPAAFYLFTEFISKERLIVKRCGIMQVKIFFVAFPQYFSEASIRLIHSNIWVIRILPLQLTTIVKSWLLSTLKSLPSLQLELLDSSNL